MINKHVRNVGTALACFTAILQNKSEKKRQKDALAFIAHEANKYFATHGNGP